MITFWLFVLAGSFIGFFWATYDVFDVNVKASGTIKEHFGDHKKQWNQTSSNDHWSRLTIEQEKFQTQTEIAIGELYKANMELRGLIADMKQYNKIDNKSN